MPRGDSRWLETEWYVRFDDVKQGYLVTGVVFSVVRSQSRHSTMEAG